MSTNEPIEPTMVTPAETPEPTPVVKRLSKRTKLIFGGVAAALAAGAAAVVIARSGSEDSDDEVDEDLTEITLGGDVTVEDTETPSE